MRMVIGIGLSFIKYQSGAKQLGRELRKSIIMIANDIITLNKIHV